MLGSILEYLEWSDLGPGLGRLGGSQERSLQHRVTTITTKSLHWKHKGKSICPKHGGRAVTGHKLKVLWQVPSRNWSENQILSASSAWDLNRYPLLMLNCADLQVYLVILHFCLLCFINTVFFTN